MRTPSLAIVELAGLFGVVVACGLLVGGCSKPDGPDDDCPDWGPVSPTIVSNELLTTPVYSPIDSCIYYVDSGEDSLYFEVFKENPLNTPPPLAIQPGIYRLHLNSDDPAQLVAQWGCDPDISPDGSSMYYHIGYWGGPIMKVRLPDGQPELVKDGCFLRACWYSPDTLVVEMCNWRFYFLDLGTDSLRQIIINGANVDVSRDRRICTSGARCNDGSCVGICDSTGIWYLGPLGCDIRAGRWSPDGEEMVFYDLRCSGGTEIRVTDLDGKQPTLATGGGPYDRTIGGVFDPDFTTDGQFVIYIMHSTPLDYDPCRGYENLVQDGQIWVMSAVDGSGKRQFSSWSRIRP